MHVNTLKLGYKFLYYVLLGAIIMNFMGHPLYSMVKLYSEGAPYIQSNIYWYLPDAFGPVISDEHHDHHNSKPEEISAGVKKSQNTGKRISEASSPNLKKENYMEFPSENTSGIIGYDEAHNADDPFDNIFSFDIDKEKIKDKQVFLSYEVYGIDNISGISRSINQNHSNGGYIVKENKEWKKVEEVISERQLKNGKNHILFTVPESKNIIYKVKNLKIIAVTEDREWVSFADKNKLYVYGGKAYIKGSVAKSGMSLSINGVYVPVLNNEFEYVVSEALKIEDLHVTLSDSKGDIVFEKTFPIEEKITADKEVIYKKASTIKSIKQDEDGFFRFDLDEVKFHLSESDYEYADNITLQHLRNIDMAPLGPNIINVTSEKRGYRFLPEGAKFKNNASLSIQFDKKLLPNGYSEQDVQILYFDIDKRSWVAIARDSVDVEHQRVLSSTDHFTDYIAGVIQAPEAPEANSFTPTSISDIKIADPTAGMVQIAPPQANQKGDGTIEFPITVPPGRNGLQPNLSLTYNNNGTSSIAGYGWDLNIPYISVDTKYGIPPYNATSETESYLMNGEELLLKNGNQLYLPHRTTTLASRIGNAVFYPKNEGRFSRVERKGTSPSNYYWEVWDKSGTKYTYGRQANTRLSSGNIAKWMLERVEDKNGNYIVYTYITKNYTTDNLAGGKEILVSSIDYNMHTTQQSFGPGHKVDFTYDEGRSDQTINYRYGFKEVNASYLSSVRVHSPRQRCDGREYFDIKEYLPEMNFEIVYDLDYVQGQFGKKLLNAVNTIHKKAYFGTPSNVIDEQTYTHAFSYYDDIKDGQLFGPEQQIDTKDDFDKDLSALGGTIEKNVVSGSIDFSAGVFFPGLFPSYIPISNAGTVSISLPFPTSVDSKMDLTMIDIDGDGLPDKVVKKGDVFKYRKNLGNGTFSNILYDITNFHGISSSRTRTTHTSHPAFSFLVGSVFRSESYSVSESNIFLTDVNADGLVDYVKDRVVYFNRIDPATGLPNFTANSDLTPNRIFKEGDVDQGVLAPLPDLSLGNDLMDVVKVWVAPKRGKVNISGIISKPYVETTNGIRYSIEHSTLFSDLYVPVNPIPGNPVPGTPVPGNPGGGIGTGPIFRGDFLNGGGYIQNPTLLVTATEHTNFSNITVSKGDMIFFRVNSSQVPLEEEVQVTWDPEVKYVEQDFDGPNSYKQYSSKFSDAYVYGDALAEPLLIKTNGIYLLSNAPFTINNSGQVPELTDDVSVKVTVYKPDTSSSEATEVILSTVTRQIHRSQLNTINNWSHAVPVDNIDENDPSTYVYVRAEVFSDSQINWKTIDDKLKLNFLNLNTNEDNWLTPKYHTFPSQVTDYYKSTFSSATTLQVKHNFQLENCMDDQCTDQYVYLVVKNQNGRIVNATNNNPAKYRYKIAANGVVSEVRQLVGTEYSLAITAAQTNISAAAGTSLYFEYYTDTPKVANGLRKYQNDYNNLLRTSTGVQPKSGYINGQTNTGLYKANIFYAQNLRGVGTLYRNWGQFAYKGAGPEENFSRIKRSYIGINNLIGAFEDEDGEGEISQDDLSNQADYAENTDPNNFVYDEDTDTYVDPNNSGNTGVEVTNHQIQAMKHFTMLKPDRANLIWKSHSRLHLGAQTMNPYLRYDIGQEMQSLNIPPPSSGSAYGAVSIVRQSVSKSKGKTSGVSFGLFGIGNSTTEANTRVLNDYQDVNGDGYPDIIGQQVQLTTYRGGLGNQIWNQNLLFESNTSGEGKSLSGGSNTIYVNALNKNIDIRIGKNDSYSANIGGNGITTTTKDDRILLDINGDGLADQVMTNGAVEFNTGNGFTSSIFQGFGESSGVKTKLSGLSGGIGSGYTSGSDPSVASSNLDFSAGIFGSNSTSTVTKNFIDINGDGLPDYIDNGNIKINTGTGFLSHQYNLPKLPESYTYQVGLSGNLHINILIPFAFFPIGIKFGGGGGASLTNHYNAELTKYVDFDGDGYPDLLHSTDEGSMTVRYSKIARTNMLRMVENPTGSRIEMNYATKNEISDQRFGNNYKMPFRKWVLSSVKIYDGFSGDGEDVQQYAFEYKNGYKDRRERKFLGFGEVFTHQLKADGTVYRTSIREYMLNAMTSHEIYLPGSTSDSRKYQYISDLLVKETIKDASDRIFSVSENEYSIYALPASNVTTIFGTNNTPVVTYTDASRILPLVKKTKSTVYHYQGDQTNNPYAVINEELYSIYDRYGNVMYYTNTQDQVHSRTTYHHIDNAQQYNASIPRVHEVMDLQQSNNTVRRTETTVTPQFNIASISRYKTYEGTGEVATTDYQYNTLGNLVQVTYPKPAMGSSEQERYYVQYEYDCLFHNYIVSIRNAHGHFSTAFYTNFGTPLAQRDINQNVFHYRYDGMLRMTQFTGPYNEEWTIRNTYHSQPDGLKYAVTQHNIQDEQNPDIQNPQEPMILHTSTFADGLGRLTQTKKQLDLVQECSPDGTPLAPNTGYRFAVSGKVFYDEFGRVVETYLPQEEKNCYDNFETKLHSYSNLSHTEPEKTSMFYDTQDRMLQSHIHGLNATTTYEYGFGFDGTTSVHKAKERVMLPEGNVTETFKDYKGRVTATKQINTDSGEELITRYHYNAIGELLGIIDAEDKTTYYNYDSFGNKTEVQHPDRGLSRFTYDLEGKLVKSATQKLINSGQEIVYKYNLNQLESITYPSHEVTYTYGTTNDQYHTVGRITKIEDLTGTKQFQYGKLGEIVAERRVLAAQNGYLQNIHNYRYDSWGRIRQMTYMDGEKLTYTYNTAGQLKSIFNADGEKYLKDVKYNFFDQPTEILYGNDVKTIHEYDITQRIRAMQLDRPDETTFMRNVYSYDRNQNITRIVNKHSQHEVLRLGGVYEKKYEYDKFNRLDRASGFWKGYQEDHEFGLGMRYNATHGIMNKDQYHFVSSPYSSGETPNSYASEYSYEDAQHPHAPSQINYQNHSGTHIGSADFRYDANGNMLNLRNNVQQIPWTFRDMIWDEQDRLMAVIDNQSSVSHYVYDHTGERTFKSEGHINEVNIAGQNIYRVLNFEKYLIYPSGYVVLNPERDEYTKHYYINNKRFVSRIGKNYFEYFKLSGSSGLTAGEDLPKNNFDELARDNDLEMPEAVYSPINIGNSPENCNQQLDVIEAMYNTPQTPLCLQQIQYIRANSSPCDALVLINSITFENCAGNDPGNEPDPDVDPEDEYTGEEMSELDCLSQINILLNGLTPLPAITGFSLKNAAVECDNDCHYYCRTECDKKCADSNDPNCYNKCEKECHEQWIEDNTPTPEPEPEDECESICYGNCYIACDGDPDCIAYCYNHCMNHGCDTFPTPSGPAQECEEHCYEVYYNNGNEEQLAYCLFKCRVEETPQNTCEQQCYENCNGDPNCMAECYYECTQDPEVVACKKTCEELCEGDPDCTQNCEQAFCGTAGGTSPCGRDCYVDCKEICSKECNGDPDCIAACIPDCMENISEETLKKCKLECLEQCNGDLDCLAACVKKCDETIVIHDPEKSCEENGMILIQEFLMLEPQMTACEILLYLNTYYYPCEEPSVPVVTPPDYVDIEDDWQDTGGNDTLPEEDFEIEPTDPIWWYHTDHLGSSTYLTNIFGRPSHYYETLPFGEMMVEHNQSLYTAGQYNNAFKFNGKELDEATQMYYYGARYYDPRFSIFVSVDPLAESTMEPYSYVGNNPIMFTDPTGMSKDGVDGDYYDSNGNWMISDGKNDGRVYHADKNGDVEYLKGVLKEFRFTEWNYDIKDSNFAEYFPTLLDHEGGFVNHPNDPGGATNKGVTINTFKKYSKSLLGVNGTVDNLKRLTDSQAAAIYEEAYWSKSGAGNISDKQIGWLHFDTYMHGGGENVLGNTIKSYGNYENSTSGLNKILNSNSGENVFNQYKTQRLNRFDRIINANPKLESFRKGWNKRVNNFQYKK